MINDNEEPTEMEYGLEATTTFEDGTTSEQEEEDQVAEGKRSGILKI